MDSGIPKEEIHELEEYRLVCTLTISNDGNTVLNIYGEELNYVIKDSCLINPGTEEKKFTHRRRRLRICGKKKRLPDSGLDLNVHNYRIKLFQMKKNSHTLSVYPCNIHSRYGLFNVFFQML